MTSHYFFVICGVTEFEQKATKDDKKATKDEVKAKSHARVFVGHDGSLGTTERVQGKGCSIYYALADVKTGEQYIAGWCHDWSLPDSANGWLDFIQAVFTRAGENVDVRISKKRQGRLVLRVRELNG